MNKLVPIGMALAFLAAACAAKQQAPAEWVKTRHSAEELEPAYAACKGGALATVDAAADKTAASTVAVREFLKCMRDKGWERAQSRPKPASPK